MGFMDELQTRSNSSRGMCASAQMGAHGTRGAALIPPGVRVLGL